VVTNSEFGYLDPVTGLWSKGGGYFAIYPTHAKFVRPRIHTGDGTASGAWYSAADLLDPVYLA
jgi:hypothetical protein